MAHPTLGTWISSPYKINLRQGGGALLAEVIHEQRSVIHFSSLQIKCGIMGTLSQESLIEKISKIAQEKLKEHIAVFAFPKEQPTEIWIFEATPMAGVQIRQGKEYLKQIKDPETALAFYEKALKNFETAFKLQQTFKGNTQELEQYIAQIRREILLLKCGQNSLLYLPNEKEVKEFQEVIAIYKDQEKVLQCFENYLSIQESLSPHHHLMSAMIHEDQKEFSKAVEAYLSLSQDNPQHIACIEKAYALFEEIKDRNENAGVSHLGVQEGHNDPAVVNSSLSPPQWTHQRQPNVSSSGSSEIPGKRSLQKDSIRMAFEKHLALLDQRSPQEKAPTCFICFNVEEKDVGKWLEETLVPDLDMAGIKPIFCFRELSQGQDLDNFQEQARSADLVIIACTPELKAKYEDRKKAPVGLAQEIRMIKGRYNDEKKANTIFPIYLKGTRKEALPTAYFESIFGAKFLPFGETGVFNYYCNAFDLFSALRGVPRDQSRQIRELFFEDLKKILRGEVDREKVEEWRSQRKKKLKLIRDSISERVSVYTQMVNLPLTPQYFTGREKELKELHDKCSHQHRVAVTGMGGVGKTTLALKYANDYKSHYQFIHFISARSSLSLINGLLKLADDLHIPKSDKSDKAEERLHWLKTTLERFEKEYLLIFDNVDQIEVFQEIEKYLPERGWCLLLTSRMPQQAKAQNFEIVELHLFSLEEASQYLLKATGLKESKEAQELAELLGRLPLALKHAAGYIRSRKGMTIQDYINAFKNYQVELFEDQYLTLTKDEMTILKTWKMSIQAIEKDHNCPLAKEILGFFAFLGQAPIPDSLVKEWGKQFYPEISDLNLENSIRYLYDYSMISSSQPHIYDIHSLVQLVTLYQMSPEKQKETFERSLTLINAEIKKFKKDDEITWDRSRLCLPHATTLSANQKKLKAIDLERQFEFMESLGNMYIFFESSQYSLNFWEKVLEIAQEWNSKENHEKSLRAIAVSYTNCGLAFKAIGKPNEAIKSYNKALSFYDGIVKKGNQYSSYKKDIANTYEALGWAYRSLSDFDKSLEFHIKALNFRNETQADPYLIASSYQGVGSAYEALRNVPEALKNYESALKMQSFHLPKKDFGVNIANTYSLFGSAYEKIKDFEKAKNYYEKSFYIRSNLFKGNHPALAISYNQLGSISLHNSEIENSLEFHNKALEIYLFLYGEEHSNVAITYNKIGLVQQVQGEAEKALESHKKALNIQRTVYGENHPDTALSYASIGSVLHDLGKPQEALNFHQKALAIQLPLLGDNHPDVMLTSHHIRKALHSLGRSSSELDDYKKTLTTAHRVSPPLKNTSSSTSQDPTQENPESLLSSLQKSPLNPSNESIRWNSSEIALHLWKDPYSPISEEMVKKVQFVTDYLKTEGFVLGGIAADGNCFLNAFLESYQTVSRKIPILDEQSDRVAYLRTCIAAEYPQDSAQDRQRADQIKKDREWIAAQGEGDLLAKGLFIPIRIVTVHQDSSGWGISDMLTFPDKEISRKEWKTILEQDRPQEYVFMVDLGGHFLYAKKSGGI